jgi:hypothetical protein
MKNLRERTSAMRESRGKDTGWLYCPQFSLSDEVCVCLAADCAHYNPDTDECVHVEAAQAQVQMASAMLNASSNLEQLRRWVADRE